MNINKGNNYKRELKHRTFQRKPSKHPAENAESILDIDFERLFDQGYRGVLLDVDNTVAKQFGSVREGVSRLIRDLMRRGFTICIVSNNRSQTHVKEIAHQLGDIPYVMHAKKPASEGFLRALQIIGISPDNTIMVGDQITADIKGGNNCGLYTIQVNPICPIEFIPIKEIPIRIKYIVRNCILHI